MGTDVSGTAVGDVLAFTAARQPPPYHSDRFPDWTTMDPRAVRAIDEAVTAFAAVKPATEAALREAVEAANRHETEIDTISREELHDALVAIAGENGMTSDEAAEVIDAARDW